MAQERRVAKNLELQNQPSDSAEYMELRDTEGVADRWRLQEDEAGAASDWQPVEYSRPPKARPSWIVPTLATVALVAMVGYAAWVGITRFDIGFGNLLTAETESTPAAEEGTDPEATDAVALDPQEGQATEPAEEATQPAATPTLAPTEAPSPTPTVELVEQRIATITNQYGVNARSEPTLDSEIIRVLEQNETVVILQEQEDPASDGNWLEVRLSEGALAWISSSFVEISTQFVPQTGSEAVAPSDTDTGTGTGDAGTTDDGTTGDTTAGAPASVSVTISSTFGLNARTAPESTADIVATLPDQSSYSADQRTEDTQWVRVQLEDGTQAWIFTSFLVADGDLSTLPTEDEAAVEPAPETGTDETADETGTDETEPEPDTEPITSTEEAGVTVVVSSTFGTNARATADTTANVLRVIPNGAEVAVEGRTEDSEWLQVELDDGRMGWIFTSSVVATAEDVASLPVVTPPPLAADTLGSQEQDADATDTGATDTGATDTDATDVSDATATVVSLLGTSARPQPNTSGEVVQAVPNGAVLPVLGRSADNQWVQVELEDGTQAWLFVNNVDLSVELESLPIAE